MNQKFRNQIQFVVYAGRKAFEIQADRLWEIEKVRQSYGLTKMVDSCVQPSAGSARSNAGRECCIKGDNN